MQLSDQFDRQIVFCVFVYERHAKECHSPLTLGLQAGKVYKEAMALAACQTLHRLPGSARQNEAELLPLLQSSFRLSLSTACRHSALEGKLAAAYRASRVHRPFDPLFSALYHSSAMFLSLLAVYRAVLNPRFIALTEI